MYHEIHVFDAMYRTEDPPESWAGETESDLCTSLALLLSYRRQPSAVSLPARPRGVSPALGFRPLPQHAR